MVVNRTTTPREQTSRLLIAGMAASMRYAVLLELSGLRSLVIEILLSNKQRSVLPAKNRKVLGMH